MYVFLNKMVKEPTQDPDLVAQQIRDATYYTYVSLSTDYIHKSGNE